MLRAIHEGFRSLARSFGLVPLLLFLNVLSAALLAVPLARTLERDLARTDAAQAMMYGFDFPWWGQWSDAQSGWTSSFAPDLFGIGFAFKNIDLLLRGYLPGGLFVVREPEAAAVTGRGAPGLDPVILGLGFAYLVLQTFLAGGVFATLRGPQGSWTIRGLLHGSGFYFGRFLRLALLVLLADFVLFRLNAPLARWTDHQAREAVSEATARAWLLGRHGLLLLAILWVNMVSGYAKAIVVLEERSSAVLAFLSALSFAVTKPLHTFGHYLSLAAMGVALLGVWHFLDSHWQTAGYMTQVVTLLLGQCLVGGRIALRLALWAGQMDLYRRLAQTPWDTSPVV